MTRETKKDWEDQGCLGFFVMTRMTFDHQG